jgi:DNA polymerase-3 subunit epsilon
MIMFASLWGKNYTRRKLFKKTDSSVMRDYLQKPFPNKKELIADIDIVSLDFETTGLNIEQDRIVSIGLVAITKLGVDLQSSSHQLIKTNSQLPETSVIIHQITDSQSANGVSVEAAFPVLLKLLSGKVMLAHNAKVELGFLNKLCNKLYNTDFIIPVVDTQYLAKRSFERQNIAYKNNELRLFNLRRSFNMPAYKAHNALMDAIATAELFLAMVNKISPGSNARLSDFLS